MSAVPGHLNDVIRFSSVDGPGNRYVIFLQGCNFNCKACHNPYTIRDCNACGLCIDPCPEDALRLIANEGLHVVVDREACTDCDICVQICPYDSTPLSRQVSIDALMADIRPVAPFLSGITVSGGEPTLQPEFLRDLFSAVKADAGLSRLTTLVDTNGSAAPETWDLLLPVLDGAMVDLKAFDDDVHIEMTGVSNRPVLASIEYLAAAGRLLEVRLLLIPGHNDNPDMLRRAADWLKTADPDVPLKLIAFRNHGVRPEYADMPEPDGDAMATYQGLFEAAGFTSTVVA